MQAYEGQEKYIFVSYAHKDSDRVLPIIEAMAERGFRIWYDSGIEVGTEWPEYIGAHLMGCECVLAFMSNASAASENCRNEINLAISEKKKLLVAYIEDTELTPGMKLHLGTKQSIYLTKGIEPFIDGICAAPMLQGCRAGGVSPVPPPSIRREVVHQIASSAREQKSKKTGAYIRLAIFLALIAVIAVALILLLPEQHTHTPGEWIVDRTPTCSIAGAQHQVCTDCGETIHSESIPASHTEGEWAVSTEPTCENVGVKHLICQKCNAVLSTVSISANGHTPGAWITDQEATCTEEGSKHQICSVCDEIIETKVTSAKGHIPGKWDVVVNPSCTKEGSKQQTCVACQEIISTDVVPPTGHTEGEWVVDIPATCVAEGSQHQVCEVCGVTIQTDVVPLAKHQYGDWIVDKEPSLTEDGKTHHICNVCGYTEEVDIPGGKHSPGRWVIIKNATCTDAGLEYLYCADAECDQVLEEKIIAATGHHYVAVVTPPTNTQQGYTTHTCSGCGDSYLDSYVDPLGSAGLIYEINPDGKSCTITDIGTCQDNHIVVPTQIEGYTVTCIGDSAFADCKDLMGITLSKEIISIEEGAFAGCTNLAEVIVGSKLNSIGYRAFDECVSLTRITYSGTAAQWNSILKNSQWDVGTGAYIVYCTDGNLSKA